MKKRKKTEKTCQTRRGCLNSVLTWPDPGHSRAAPVRSRAGSATRRPCSEPNRSSVLVIERDAAAAVRERRLLFPFTTGAGPCRRTCGGTSATGRSSRPRRRAAPRARSGRLSRTPSSMRWLRLRRMSRPGVAGAGGGRTPRVPRVRALQPGLPAFAFARRPRHRSRPGSAPARLRRLSSCPPSSRPSIAAM